jgi:hypothetical protein
MLAQVYVYTGDVTRSVVRARLVEEVEIDEVPEDQAGFAAEHGGDFIEILNESLLQAS